MDDENQKKKAKRFRLPELSQATKGWIMIGAAVVICTILVIFLIVGLPMIFTAQAEKDFAARVKKEAAKKLAGPEKPAKRPTAPTPVEVTENMTPRWR